MSLWHTGWPSTMLAASSPVPWNTSSHTPISVSAPAAHFSDHLPVSSAFAAPPDADGTPPPQLMENPAVRALVVTAYSVAVALAALGNVATIVVYARGEHCKTDLRPFLISLALADLLMGLFCIPFTSSQVVFGNRWLLPGFLYASIWCPSVLYLQLVAVQVSVLTNMSIGIDRLWAVRFPLRSRVTASRWKLCVALVWTVALLAHAVQLVVGRAKRIAPPPESAPTPIAEESTAASASTLGTTAATVAEAAVGETTADVYEEDAGVSCGEQWESWSGVQRAYSTFVLLVTYLLPLAILAVTYSLVAVTLWRRTTPGNADENRDRLQLRGRIKVTKMLVAIVALFGLCWLPLHTFFALHDFSSAFRELLESKSVAPFAGLLYFACHWLAMANSFVNPLIYFTMQSSFRRDFLQLFSCGYLKAAKSPSQVQRTPTICSARRTESLYLSTTGSVGRASSIRCANNICYATRNSRLDVNASAPNTQSFGMERARAKSNGGCSAQVDRIRFGRASWAAGDRRQRLSENGAASNNANSNNGSANGNGVENGDSGAAYMSVPRLDQSRHNTITSERTSQLEIVIETTEPEHSPSVEPETPTGQQPNTPKPNESQSEERAGELQPLMDL